MRGICLIRIALVCCVIISLSGCVSPLTRGEIFRGEWFDYYNRGITHVKSGETEAAERDLKHALVGRSGDTHSARTYGVHFQDYYPHRELGILALEQGDWEKALRELEISCQTAPTSRGIHFLNEARRMQIVRGGLDRLEPVINIDVSSESVVTNQRRFEVKGTVEDDTYVAWIGINNEPVFFELGEQKKSFSETLSLATGKNLITVTATDFGGRSAEKSIVVELDVQGPSLSLNEVQVLAGDDGNRLWLKGAAYDPNGIAEFRIGEKSVGDPSARIDLAEWFPVISGQDSVDYFLKDLCGNETRGKISLDGLAQGFEQGWLPEYLSDPVQTGMAERKPPLLASVNAMLPPLACVAVPERGTAIFDFGRLGKRNTVYREDFCINGSVHDPDGIVNLNVNGEDCQIVPGRDVRFSHFADLKSGTNTIRFVAENSNGMITEVTLPIVLKQPAYHQAANRLKLASYGFAAEGKISPAIREMVRHHLESNIANQSRFSLLERLLLDAILTEHKIAEISAQQWPKLSTLTPADVLLFGTMVDWGNGFDIFLKIVNAKAPDIPIGELNIYQPDKENLEGLHRTIKGLYYHLENEFPLVEGKVIRCERSQIITDLSLSHGIKPGFDLVVFRRGDPIIENGVDYGCPETDLGTATVEKVFERLSYAMTEHECEVEKGDFVITR